MFFKIDMVIFLFIYLIIKNGKLKIINAYFNKTNII